MTDLTRAAEILEEHAESVRDGCNDEGEETFNCADCPVGRETCKREYDEIVAAAAAVRLTMSSAALAPIEPVAWRYVEKETGIETLTAQPPDRVTRPEDYEITPLYAAPAPTVIGKAPPSQSAHDSTDSAAGAAPVSPPSTVAAPFDKVLKDHLWKMYQEGKISADHTAREVFDQMLDSLSQWLQQQPSKPPSATKATTEEKP